MVRIFEKSVHKKKNFYTSFDSKAKQLAGFWGYLDRDDSFLCNFARGIVV